MRRAYSYTRFSTPDQAKGDSLRRQTEAVRAYCERKKLLLDDTFNLCDMGVSAFKGKNADVGNLGLFRDAVRTGRVPRGSVLIVESLDRLSREKIGDAHERFRELVKAGITIVTLSPEREYTEESLNSFGSLLEPLFHMSRSHEESAMKSTRLRAVWEEKKRRAGEKRVTRNGPAWLRPTDDGKGFKVIEKHAKIVRRIYTMARDGHGQSQITATLNRERVQPIGRCTGYWRKAYVTKILQTRAVVGEYQPCILRDGKFIPHGKPVPNYFPPIISEEDWRATRRAIELRRHQRGPLGQCVRNLFTSLVRDARDGGTMGIRSPSPKKKTVPYLVSSRSVRGESALRPISFPYELFESHILYMFDQEQVAELLRDSNGKETEATALAAELTTLEQQMHKWRQKCEENPDSDEFANMLRKLEKKKKAQSEALERLRREQSSSNAEVLGELRSIRHLWGEAPPEESTEFRTRLKQRIRLLVESIWVLIEKEGTVKVAHVQIFFRNGKEVYFQAQYRQTKPTGKIVKTKDGPVLLGDFAPHYPSPFTTKMERIPRIGDLRTWRERHPPARAAAQKQSRRASRTSSS